MQRVLIKTWLGWAVKLSCACMLYMHAVYFCVGFLSLTCLLIIAVVLTEFLQ